MVLDVQVREAKQAKDAKITALNDNTWLYSVLSSDNGLEWEPDKGNNNYFEIS